jgi:hypothetical protein
MSPRTTVSADLRGATPPTLRNTRSAPTQGGAPDQPYRPEGNVIEFQVVDGYAIAYGDLVLGKPEPSFSGNKGYYDAPNPQPWERPEIPYAIHPDLPDPQRVEKALDYLRTHSPVSFVPYQGQKDAILFEPGTEHCYSGLGRMGGLQPIRLSPECQPQQIMHEVMHALGFVHEQSRPDRDQYVEVLWPNIEEKYRLQFEIVPSTFLEALRDSPFDFHSIMLYPANAFALHPDLMTLRALGTESIAPVQEGLSESDLHRLSRLF